MTEHLKAPRFAARISVRVFGLIAISLAPTVIGLAASSVVIPLWFSVGSFVIGSIAAALVSARWLREFHCPRCGASVPQHEPTMNAINAPIVYNCKSCDVVWDTGLRTPSNM
jgi:hypothetical protein